MNTKSYTGANSSASSWYYGVETLRYNNYYVGIDPTDTPAAKEKLTTRLNSTELSFKSLPKFSI